VILARNNPMGRSRTTLIMPPCPMKHTRSLLALAGFGLTTAGAAWYGARYSRNGSHDTWYRSLNKRTFTPPNEVFPVVWTSLYALMAWSGWKCGAPLVRGSATLHCASGRRNLRPMANGRSYFSGNTVLWWRWLTSSRSRGRFGPISMRREGSTVPPPMHLFYAAWVAFATVLNAEFARLNPRAAA
jgi:benzodiazapine receptor